MAAERSELKEIIRKEFENQIAESAKEVESLKNEMAALKTSHVLELARRDQLALQAKAEAQKELNQVYNRYVGIILRLCSLITIFKILG